MAVKFGLICEGVRDQAVIRAVLEGFFADQPGDAIVKPVIPPDPPVGIEVGGWTVLKALLLDGRHREALQFNDYLVVHIDTDVCDEVGFAVPRMDPATGKQLDPDALRAAVIARLGEWMGHDFIKHYGDRILYAIAVDGIECWLLPLLVTLKATQAKTAGCLAAANHALKKAGKSSLKNSPDGPVRPYQDAAAPYRKRKMLLRHGRLSPSLAAFLAELDARGIQILEDDDDD